MMSFQAPALQISLARAVSVLERCRRHNAPFLVLKLSVFTTATEFTGSPYCPRSLHSISTVAKMPAPPAKMTSGEKAAAKKVKAKENKAKANPALAAANKVPPKPQKAARSHLACLRFHRVVTSVT